MIKYDKLFELLKERGLSKTDLYNVITPPTVAALVKNEPVKMSSINNICVFLQVQPNAIMEVDLNDFTHASWRSKDGYDTKFTDKRITTAEEFLSQQADDLK